MFFGNTQHPPPWEGLLLLKLSLKVCQNIFHLQLSERQSSSRNGIAGTRPVAKCRGVATGRSSRTWSTPANRTRLRWVQDAHIVSDGRRLKTAVEEKPKMNPRRRRRQSSAFVEFQKSIAINSAVKLCRKCIVDPLIANLFLFPLFACPQLYKFFNDLIKHMPQAAGRKNQYQGSAHGESR